jgi:integrase
MELATQVYQTPLEHHLDAFMASRGQLKADTLRRYTGPMKALGAWLKREGLPATIETVDRRVAIRYVDQLSPGRPDPKRLSLYWQWMVKREHAPSDPWSGITAAPRARLEPERAFTDDEAKRLLEGPCTHPLRLLMQVAALTGARLDAVFNMRVVAGRDGQGDTIIFPPQKKELGPRTIPLHSHLREPLAGFSGWSAWPSSNGAGKAFMAHRRKVLGPDPAGRRRAIVNMHSWRRWFISKAERAGIDERIISDVVGHKRRSMTGRYSAGASMEQMRACVEAVKLPGNDSSRS